METANTEPAPAPLVVATGTTSVDERIAAAAQAITQSEEDAAPATQPASDDAAEGEQEAAEAKPAEGKPAKPAKGKDMLRDVAADWAVARRMRTENTKRAAELDARTAQLDTESVSAREVASLMAGDPVRAVERLSQLAGISPTEYLQRLQLAYINGDAPAPKASASSEVAELRAELYAERNQRAAEEQQRQYQAQVVEVATSETATLVNLARSYAEQFPSLQVLSDAALQHRVADAVDFYLRRGDEVGRFEVLQAVDNIVSSTLDEYGIRGNLSGRGASSPAPNGGRRPGTNAAPTRPRNGTGRNIPTNAATADSGARNRPSTVEERLAEATKVLWSNE